MLTVWSDGNSGLGVETLLRIGAELGVPVQGTQVGLPSPPIIEPSWASLCRARRWVSPPIIEQSHTMDQPLAAPRPSSPIANRSAQLHLGSEHTFFRPGEPHHREKHVEVRSSMGVWKGDYQRGEKRCLGRMGIERGGQARRDKRRGKGAVARVR